jgi:hypothetical protein
MLESSRVGRAVFVVNESGNAPALEGPAEEARSLAGRLVRPTDLALTLRQFVRGRWPPKLANQRLHRRPRNTVGAAGEPPSLCRQGEHSKLAIETTYANGVL